MPLSRASSMIDARVMPSSTVGSGGVRELAARARAKTFSPLASATKPLAVEQDRLVVAVEERLALREDRVHVVAAGLALGHLRVDVVAREARRRARGCRAPCPPRRGTCPRARRRSRRGSGCRRGSDPSRRRRRRRAAGCSPRPGRFARSVSRIASQICVLGEGHLHQVDVRGLEQPPHVLLAAGTRAERPSSAR